MFMMMMMVMMKRKGKIKCGGNLASFLGIFQLLVFPNKSQITPKQVTFL
jgi:hypothetical protein